MKKYILLFTILFSPLTNAAALNHDSVFTWGGWWSNVSDPASIMDGAISVNDEFSGILQYNPDDPSTILLDVTVNEFEFSAGTGSFLITDTDTTDVIVFKSNSNSEFDDSSFAFVSLILSDSTGTAADGLDGLPDAQYLLDNFDSGRITITQNIFDGISMKRMSMTGIVDVRDVPTVPIPPAVWLFASGLLGLVSVARRS